MSEFFISCPLNFENELTQELKEFWFEMMDLDGLPTRSEFPEYRIVDGGIELSCPEHLGFQINFFSKIANRVLLRIKKFEARYFDQLEKEVKKLDLSKWLLKKDIELKIESHKSRLNNSKNIEDVFTRSLNQQGYRLITDSQKVFVRIFKDQVTISLDTSGEHLHRRGYAEYRGEAPLRETLAAIMVRFMKNNTRCDLENDIFLDPFAGSGTLLFEAASATSPQFDRFYSWLSFKTAPKIFQSNSWKANYRWVQKNQFQAIAVDQSEKAIFNLNKNSELFKKHFSQIDLQIACHTMDALNFTLNQTEKSVWLVTNPPYGHRLEAGNIPEILRQLEKNILNLKGITLIHPMDWKIHFEKLKLVQQTPFSNQGLKLYLSTFNMYY